MDEIANIRHDPRQPWVGQTAFAHKGGMHVHAIERVARSYEHINPAGGRQSSARAGQRHVGPHEHSASRPQELGFKLSSDTPELKTILARIKELESQGYEFEAAEGSLALLIRKILQHEEPPFTGRCLSRFHARQRHQFRLRSHGQSSRRRTSRPHRGRRRRAGERPRLRLARGACQVLSPAQKSELTDYKVRILESSTGTAAKTRVLIESTDGHEEWGTVGVSENIIEASLQALADAIEFALAQLRRP